MQLCNSSAILKEKRTETEKSNDNYLINLKVNSTKGAVKAVKTRLFHQPVILCIFMCRAWMRPFASLCFAMMQRMWSAKMKLACRMGKGLACGLELGLWMMMFRALLSSSTPDTCMSC